MAEVSSYLRERYSPPLEKLLAPLVAAEDAVARLDERLSKSGIRQAWIDRTHFAEAAASLWNEGETVHMEDLVLHEAGMDIHTPTRELARGIRVVRARRQILCSDLKWPITDVGLAFLRAGDKRDSRHSDGQPSIAIADGRSLPQSGEGDSEFEDIDRSISSSVDAVRSAEASVRIRDPLVYDPDWDEDERITTWQRIVLETETMPTALAVAICEHAWSELEPLQHRSWLGPQLSAAIFRAREKTRSHLACLNVGVRVLGGRRPRPSDIGSQLVWRLNAIKAGAEWGVKEHDRWFTARDILSRKLRGRRSTSRLGELIDLAVAKPLISVGLVAKELKVTKRAAQILISELDLNERTGRSRYRAWSLV